MSTWQKLGTCVSLFVSVTVSATVIVSVSVFMFMLKSGICEMSSVNCQLWNVKCLHWSLGHAEQLLFSCLCSKVSICNYVSCHMSHFACHMSHVIYVKRLCWYLGHAEQLLFSCVSSKVSICNYVTCHMSHVTCHMSNAYVDPWAMLNNFCFHVYAQMSLFMGEKCNDYFLTSPPAPSPVSEPIIELVPS